MIRIVFLKVLVPLALLCMGTVNVAHAVIETYEFSNSALEQRYKTLSAELRCPKCQNQNIADSNAPISQDLRKLLYKQLETGASDEEILEYMVSRYGEFVRYKPRFSGVTLILWAMPFLLLAAAIVVVIMVLRGGKRTERAINAEEQQQLDELLAPNTAPGDTNKIVENDT